MNFLTYLEHLTPAGSPTREQPQFLVSGEDAVMRQSILQKIIRDAGQARQMLVVLDDLGDSRLMEACGLRPAHMPLCLYDPFSSQSLTGVSRFRRLLQVLGYDEKQKAKVCAYLSLIRHIKQLEGEPSLTFWELAGFSTSFCFERHLAALVTSGKIDSETQIFLLSKYSELSSSAADLDDAMMLLSPFCSGQPLGGRTAAVLSTVQLGGDKALRNVLVQLLCYGMEDTEESLVLVILDSGTGDRAWLPELLSELPVNVTPHLLSRDIFTLTQEQRTCLNRFDAQVFGRHVSASSCEMIERVCGDMDVVKKSYTQTYDRRWRANRPIDVLFGRNKTETYTKQAAVREPRFRKEQIAVLPDGIAILQYQGNASLVTV